MAQVVWKEYTFADGYITICKGMSKRELAWEESKHGKVVSIRTI